MCVYSQSWVTQYFEGPDGVEIAVENIDQLTAGEKIRQAAADFVSNFEFRIIQPVGGNYIACPVMSPADQVPPQNGLLSNGELLLSASNQFCLCPGMQLYSPRMEPDDVGHAPVSGYAMYAGSVRGSWFGEYGLTVGHLFDAVGTECQRRALPWFPVSITVGKCSYKVESVDLVKSIRRTTADLALIQLNCPSQNVIRLNNRDYQLRLYRGKLDIRKIGAVAILTKDGAARYGRVNNFLFTIDRLNLYNTMSIVDIERQSTKLNDAGDSGALVTSVPNDSDEIFVFGMVIGYYESNDGSQSSTVATRLWDVLDCVTNGMEHSADLDFAEYAIDCSIAAGGAAAATGGLQPVVSESDETRIDLEESGYATNLAD